jgi:hypothetical protein
MNFHRCMRLSAISLCEFSKADHSRAPRNEVALCGDDIDELGYGGRVLNARKVTEMLLSFYVAYGTRMSSMSRLFQ